MCSRFSVTSPSEAVRSYFNYATDVEFPPLYNICPTDPVLVVRTGVKGNRELEPMRWGLIPSWVKDPDNFSTLINARSETVLEKPSFKNAMRRRRCLIPATGFYEWTGEKGHKRPYYIHKEDEALFAFAGLWETWLGADGTEIDTMTILTREPNKMMEKIHHRMPQVIKADYFDDWLNCTELDGKDAIKLMEPVPDDFFIATEVSTKLNNPSYKEPDVNEPLQSQLF